MTEKRNLPTLAQLTTQFLDRVIDQEQPDVFLTGIESIDKSLGGIRRGEMAVVGGRPSHGKSMLGLQWLANVAANGTPCLLVSEEMGAEALALRMLATTSEASRKDISREAYGQLWEDVEQFWTGRAPVYVAIGLRSVGSVVTLVAEAVAYRGVGFVVVDYLQLLRGSGVTRYEQISDVSSTLKNICTAQNVAMIALAQLGRGVETRDNTPRMSDLKDSGQIEQDADQILLVQWPLKSDPEYKPWDEYRVYCEKNRNGAIHERLVKLRIIPTRQVLREIEVKEMSNYQSQFDSYNQGEF